MTYTFERDGAKVTEMSYQKNDTPVVSSPVRPTWSVESNAANLILHSDAGPGWMTTISQNGGSAALTHNDHVIGNGGCGSVATQN
jgi:hypothetical protein